MVVLLLGLRLHGWAGSDVRETELVGERVAVALGWLWLRREWIVVGDAQAVEILLTLHVSWRRSGFLMHDCKVLHWLWWWELLLLLVRMRSDMHGGCRSLNWVAVLLNTERPGLWAFV